MKEELTKEEHESFKIKENQDLKHRVFSLLSLGIDKYSIIKNLSIFNLDIKDVSKFFDEFKNKTNTYKR